MSRHLLRTARTTLCVAAAFAWSTPAAPAFYFDGWPGSGLTARHSIAGPRATSVTLGLGTTTGGGLGGVDYGGHDTHTVTKQSEPPSPPEVPEPLTAVLAACGLAALGLRRLTRPGATAGGRTGGTPRRRGPAAPR